MGWARAKPVDLAAGSGRGARHGPHQCTGEVSSISRDDLLNGLSEKLPDVVDQLTPDGRLPTEDEAARMV